MNRYLAVVFVLLGAVFIAVQSGLAEPQQFDSVGEFVVESFDDIPDLNISVQEGESVTFRLSECPLDTQAPCSVSVYASSVSLFGDVHKEFTSLSMLQSGGSGTLVCAFKIYNSIQVEVASIEIQQPTTFYSQYGRSPFAWTGQTNVVLGNGPGYNWTNPTVTKLPNATNQQSGVGYAFAEANLS